MVPSPLSVFRRIISPVFSSVQHTTVSLSSTSLRCSRLSVSPWCYRFPRGVCSLWSHAHIHIFCHFQFRHVVASHRHSLHPVQHRWLNNLLMNRWILLSNRTPLASSSSWSIHSVSCCSVLLACLHRSACFTNFFNSVTCSSLHLLHQWAAVVSRGWAKASRCRLQVNISQILSLQYLSRSSLHHLTGLPCPLFLSDGLQIGRSIGRL